MVTRLEVVTRQMRKVRKCLDHRKMEGRRYAADIAACRQSMIENNEYYQGLNARSVAYRLCGYAKFPRNSPERKILLACKSVGEAFEIASSHRGGRILTDAIAGYEAYMLHRSEAYWSNVGQVLPEFDPSSFLNAGDDAAILQHSLNLFKLDPGRFVEITTPRKASDPPPDLRT